MSGEAAGAGGAAEAAYERRGVENPRIVDLIAPDPGSGEIVLSLLEGRPWSGGREQLEQHDEKLDAYFVYVLDGHLAREYPQYKGMPARIELVCVEEPGEAERPFLGGVSRAAADNGLRFGGRIDPDPFAGRAPWGGPGAEG
jgi:hypothetical protein